ncbi:MAG: YdbH domain-containing protein, partial [Gammaproteobacteria bacterium]|nr:YdbH domain-containing protein [Gammaproteobacteria bacterium]
LRFKACGQQINFERNVTLPLLDGEMQFDHLDLKQLDNGTIDFSFATEINNISLTALSKAFNLPPLAGYLSASIPSVRLEKGGLRLDSSIHIDVFGGKIEIKDLQIDGMLGSYPILTADILFEKLDLGKLSKRFSFGNIEGKLNGTIKGLRIENQKVIAFDAAFSTPENRFLPYSISQKAVQNIASLGGSSPADLLSRGVLKLFESFFYSRLGFSCKLRDNVCELKGVAPAENKGFYLIKGTLAPQINVIGYEQRVNWSELATRLKRITAQSSPVVQ